MAHGLILVTLSTHNGMKASSRTSQTIENKNNVTFLKRIIDTDEVDAGGGFKCFGDYARIFRR